MHAHTFSAGSLDGGLELRAATVEHTYTVASCESKHTRQVLRFVVGERNSIAGRTGRRRKEPREGHATEL